MGELVKIFEEKKRSTAVEERIFRIFSTLPGNSLRINRQHNGTTKRAIKYPINEII